MVGCGKTRKSDQENTRGVLRKYDQKEPTALASSTYIHCVTAPQLRSCELDRREAVALGKQFVGYTLTNWATIGIKSEKRDKTAAQDQHPANHGGNGHHLSMPLELSQPPMMTTSMPLSRITEGDNLELPRS